MLYVPCRLSMALRPDPCIASPYTSRRDIECWLCGCSALLLQSLCQLILRLPHSRPRLCELCLQLSHPCGGCCCTSCSGATTDQKHSQEHCGHLQWRAQLP